ncbi:MAG: hypothetical protein ACFFEY_05855 [Candidatus Thorarchaeota archaeon]
MVSFENEFDSLKESNNPEILNEFLIKLSESPNIKYFEFIEYLISKLDNNIFEKIKLNLVYLIGEIAKTSVIDVKYLDFLNNTYYTSDRWVRDEIIQAIEKTSKRNEIGEKLIKLIGYGINDDYLPIRIDALKAILSLDKIPIFVYKNIFLALNSRENELEKISSEILSKNLSDYRELFNILDKAENYKICKSNAIRSLLLTFFQSTFNLEFFRKKILNSNWENEHKKMFLNEINTYEKIILKKI